MNQKRRRSSAAVHVSETAADEVEGWRGRIEDGEVVETHEEALEREEQERDQDQYDEGSDEDYGDEDTDELG